MTPTETIFETVDYCLKNIGQKFDVLKVENGGKFGLRVALSKKLNPLKA